MADTIYNLDEDAEYFSFSLNGNLYTFKYPNVEQSDELRKLVYEQDEDGVRKFLFQFITPVDKGEIAKEFTKMSVKSLKKFMEMIKSELL